MHLRQAVEKQIGKISNSELQFALTNLRLEIIYKCEQVITFKQMKNILIANIEFYRNHYNKKIADLELVVQEQHT